MTNKHDIEDLQQKIQHAKSSGVGQKQDKTPPSNNGTTTDAESMNLGMRAGSELLVGMIAGGLIGYGLDHWLSTKPIFFLLFLILGVGAGFLNIYKLSQNIGTSVGFAQMHQKQKTKETNEL